MALVKILNFDSLEVEKTFLGPNNQNLSLIASELGISLNHINSAITIDEKVVTLNESYYQVVKAILETIVELLKKQVNLESRDYLHIIHTFVNDSDISKSTESIVSFYQNKKVVLNTYEGKKIIAKTLAQKHYIDALESSSIVFVTGSAGTGKTYLAVAYAVNMLKKNQIRKIIITRPAVEAGEKLGFLPGDLKEKVDPYLIPIYDALYEFMGKENVDKLIEKG